MKHLNNRYFIKFILFFILFTAATFHKMHAEKIRTTESGNIRLVFYESGDLLPNELTPEDWPDKAIQGIIDAFTIVDETFHINNLMTIGFIWSKDLEEINVLAEAYNNFVSITDTNEFPELDPNYKYPKELLNQLSSSNEYNEENITFAFNSMTKWCLSINEQPDSDEQDIITVTLHELTHGLGMSSMFTHKTKDYSFPYIFDKYIADHDNKLILDSRYYPNEELQKELLTSDRVHFSGPNTLKSNKNTPIKLHAPSELTSASICHVDMIYEDNQNANLMIPGTQYGQTTRYFGGHILAILKDVGWTIKDSAPYPPITNNIQTENDNNRINLFAIGNTIHLENMDSKTLSVSIYSTNGKQIKKEVLSGNGEYVLMPQSIYFIKVNDKAYKINTH